MTVGSIIVFSNGDRKMTVNMANSPLPNEEAISSLVRRVHRATTEEVPRERSRVSGGDSSNVKEELSRIFQIPRVVAQQPPLCNPRVREAGTPVPVMVEHPCVQSVTYT